VYIEKVILEWFIILVRTTNLKQPFLTRDPVSKVSILQDSDTMNLSDVGVRGGADGKPDASKAKTELQLTSRVHWVDDSRPIAVEDLAVIDGALDGKDSLSPVENGATICSSMNGAAGAYSWEYKTLKSDAVLTPTPSTVQNSPLLRLKKKLPQARWIRVILGAMTSTFSGALMYFWPTFFISNTIFKDNAVTQYTSTLPSFIFLIFFAIGTCVASRVCESIGPQIQMILGAFMVMIGSLVSAQGLVLLDIFTFLCGQGVLTGVGCGMFYAAPIAGLNAWFPDDKKIGLLIPISSFSLGPVVWVPIWYYSFEALPKRPDIVIVASGTFFFLAVILAALFIAPPTGESTRSFKQEQCGVQSMVIADGEGTFTTPPIHVPLGKAWRSKSFLILLVAYSSLAFIQVLLLYEAVFQVYLKKRSSLNTMKSLVLFASMGLLGRLSALATARYMPRYSLFLLDVALLMNVITSPIFASSFSPIELTTYHVSGSFSCYAFGMGVVIIPALIADIFGVFIANALHGMLLLCYLGIGTISYFLVFANDVFLAVKWMCYVSVILSFFSLLLLTQLELDPYRRLLNLFRREEYTGDREPLVFGLVFGYDIEVTRRVLDKKLDFHLISPETKMNRILACFPKWKEEHSEYIATLKGEIPKSPADIPWISWSLNAALMWSLSFSALLCALIFLVPFVALVVKLIQCTNGERTPIEQLISSWERFLVYSLANLIVPLVFLLGLSIVMAYALVTPVTKMRKRIQDVDSFVFTSDIHKADFTAIKELYQLNCAVWSLRQSMRTFSKFVPETVVRNTIKDGKVQTLDARRKHVTVFFSDIASFTTISETLDQHVLIDLLTTYLTAMIEIIEAHGGVVVEILGDGIFAIWNSPDEVENHAFKACKCAVEQQVEMAAINHQVGSLMMQHNLPPMSIRIGINTGTVFTGIIGSASKMKFGCIGEDMHLAALLEDTCKVYGARIILSLETKNEILAEDAGMFVFRELDVIRTGSHTTTIFEIMVDASVRQRSDLFTDKSEWLILKKDMQLFEVALTELRQGNFKAAMNQLELVPLLRRDKYWEMLAIRCMDYVSLFGPSLENYSGSEAFDGGVIDLN